MYLSYLMGAPNISDEELVRMGVVIVGTKTEHRMLHVPSAALARYEKLITEKMDNGFWNDLISEDEIIFLFKLLDGSIKRFVYAKEKSGEIAHLCSDLNGDPIEKTSNVLAYLGRNPFYEDTVRRYVYNHLLMKWAAAGGLFFNGEGKLLVAKPTSKKNWTIPGGNIDAHEAPLQTFLRARLLTHCLFTMLLCYISIQGGKEVF